MAFRYTKVYDGPAAAQKKTDPESYETKKQTTPKEASQETGQKETGKKATGGEIAKNAVYSGLNQFNRGLASTLDFLLPTEFLGKFDVFSNLNDYYSGLSDKYGNQLEESISDRSKAVQMGAKVLENTTAAAPNALLAVMSGGSSAATQGSSAALSATSAAAGKSVAANVVQQTMRDPLYWFSAAQTLGNNYEGAKATGASDLQAIGSAFAASALNAAVETEGGMETLPNVLKLGGDGPATAWAKSALTEGLEEPVQSAVSGASEKLFFDKGKPMFSLSDRSAVIHPGRMAEEFAAGAAVGGILGAGQLAGSKLYTDPMELAKQGDYSGLIRELDDHIRARKLDEILVEYEKRMGSTSFMENPTADSVTAYEFNGQTEYSEWLVSIGAEGSELDTLEKYNEAKYNNTSEYQLLSGYGKAVEKGDISPLVGYKEYSQTDQLLRESVVGTVTPTGVKIESFATHFIDRVIGQTSTTHPGMRCGVAAEDVVDALKNPIEDGPIWRMEDGDIRQKFVGTSVSVLISVRDNRLISTNPKGGN